MNQELISEEIAKFIMEEEENFYEIINLSEFGVPRISFGNSFREDHLGVHKDVECLDLDDFLYKQLDYLFEDYA